MRDYRIEISPFKFVALLGLEIRQEINAHAAAKVSMLIKEGWQEQYMDALSDETWVTITAVEDVPEKNGAARAVLFCGVVTDFALSRDGYETILELGIASGTILMDVTPHFRVFQNASAKCSKICKQITSAYREQQVLYLEGEAEETKGVLIQCQETDWEFLKRLAGRNGQYLVPDVLGRGVRYTVGMPDGTERAVQQELLQLGLDMGEYMGRKRNGMGELELSDMVELEFTSREIYAIGDSIGCHGRQYFIYKIETDYAQAECRHTYHMRRKEGLKALPADHGGIAGRSFNALVTGVDKDKVQVSIEGDEWGAGDGKNWFPYATVYSSPDGTGWYCMPETGDSVRLYVPDREENSFVISSVHKETDTSRQDPNCKSFKTKFGKEMLFTPDSIILTNNQGMRVELKDGEGITITSDGDIVVQATDNLTISSEKASLLIAAEEKVQVRQGATTMTLDEDISFTGGQFRIQ